MNVLRPQIEFTEHFSPLFIPSHENYHTRFLTWYGGRAGAKSWQIARGILCRMMKSRIKVLCVREYQNSIADSSLSILQGQARELGISGFFSFTKQGILAANGSEVILKGIKANPNSIKSIEGVDICWPEEAESISEASWSILIPTIRKPGSQFFISFNTSKDDDPTYVRFVKNIDADHYCQKVTYLDNPWCPEEIIKDAEKMSISDPDAYANIYLGEPWTRSDSQVLNGKWEVGEMEYSEDWLGPYYGSDFGFSTDPATLIKMYIIPQGPEERAILYIKKEAYGHGIEIDDYPEFYRGIPGSEEHVIRADNSRPELISYIRKKKFRIQAAAKWAGSVEDGISYLRTFSKIVIDPSCKYTIQEAREWKYKTDRLTGDVLPVVIDANNHCWDAIRYALQPMIKPQKQPQMRTT